MEQPLQSYKTGAVLVLTAGVLWSLMGLALRMIGPADTWQILFYRSLGMVPVLVIVITLRSGGHPFLRMRQVGLAGVLGALALAVAFAGAIFAIRSTTIANAVFLFAASPFLTAVLAWALLGEPVRPATWGAIILAMAGVALMVREGLAIGAGWGNLAALTSALGFAAFTVTLRWGRLADMMPAVLLAGLFSLVVAGAVTLISGTGLGVNPLDAAIAAATGALLLVSGMVLYTLGSRSLPAAETALLSLVEVLLAPVWVWLFLGETASAGTFVGGAVVLAAVVFNAISGTSARAAA